MASWSSSSTKPSDTHRFSASEDDIFRGVSCLLPPTPSAIDTLAPRAWMLAAETSNGKRSRPTTASSQAGTKHSTSRAFYTGIGRCPRYVVVGSEGAGSQVQCATWQRWVGAAKPHSALGSRDSGPTSRLPGASCCEGKFPQVDMGPKAAPSTQKAPTIPLFRQQKRPDQQPENTESDKYRTYVRPTM